MPSGHQKFDPVMANPLAGMAVGLGVQSVNTSQVIPCVDQLYAATFFTLMFVLFVSPPTALVLFITLVARI